jgi:biopolymer transport protein ExbD
MSSLGGDDFGLRKRPRRVAEINLINMIDMLFFLLVFFVLTSSFTSETGIDINKPKASSSKTLPRQPLLIGVTKDGSIHVNESPVSLKALGTVLKSYMSQDPDRAVVIVADRDASIAKAVDILDECNLANVKKVSISSLKE